MVGDSTWDCEAAGRAGIADGRGAAPAASRRPSCATPARWRCSSRSSSCASESAKLHLSDGQATRELPRQARLRARPPSRAAAATAGRRATGASWSSSTTPATCTGTCASSTTASLSRGRCRAASRPTRTRTGSRCTPRTTRSSTSTSRARSPRASTAPGRWRSGTRGTYEAEKFRENEVIATFHGERMQGPLRAVPHARQGLADPPHGPARGSRLRADAGPHRADAGPPGRAAARRAEAGASRSSGTASARSRSSTTATSRCRGATSRDFTPRYPEVRGSPASSAPGG